MTHSTLSAADLLTDALRIISKPETWTQGGIARNARGHLVRAQDEDATSWCATGALACALHRRLPNLSPTPGLHLTHEHAIRILNSTVRALTAGRYKRIATYNDSTNHDCILHTFDIAITDALLSPNIASPDLHYTP